MARGAVGNRGGDTGDGPGRTGAVGTAGAAALVLLAGLLLVFSLLGRLELTTAAERLAVCAEEIRELEEERARLEIARSAAMDLGAAERYAAEELGMCRPRPGDGESGESPAPDRVTVFDVPGAAQAVRAAMERLRACFS